MDTINSDAMHKIAASFAAEANWDDEDNMEVHTVTIQLNGRHGGADVTILVATPGDENYEKTWEVH